MDDLDPKPTADDGVALSPANDEPRDGEVSRADTVADSATSASDSVQHGSPSHAIRSGAQRLTEQAHDQARSFADQGKERITGVMDQLAQMLTEAAGQVDTRLGGHYGDYARRVAGEVSGFSEQIRNRNSDQIFNEVGEAVRKSPGVALGVSTAMGFVVARLISSGLEQRNQA